MSKGVRIYKHGGIDVLKWESFDAGVPGENEVLIKHSAIGVNFADISARKGLFPVPIPSGLGSEAAGRIVQCGNGVSDFSIGDEVAYTFPQQGAYSELRVCPTEHLIKLPAGLNHEVMAASLMKGLTAEFLINRTVQIEAGDTVLINAAAGGLGLIACQWMNFLGATVIGVVSSEEKTTLARENGCSHVLLVAENIVAKVKTLTGGRGVDVAYDSVGKDQFLTFLDCLRPRGMLISFGNASGPPPDISPMELMKRGSLYLTKPSGAHYLATKAERDCAAVSFFKLVQEGHINIHIGQRFKLQNAQDAHRAIESRTTLGSTILIP